VYLSQSYFAVPKMIRMNLNYVIIKRLNTLQDLFRMMREYSLGVSKDVLVDLYQHSIQNKQARFSIGRFRQRTPRDRFRFNFLDVYDLKEAHDKVQDNIWMLNNPPKI